MENKSSFETHVFYKTHPVLQDWWLTGSQNNVTQNTEMKLRWLRDTFSGFVVSRHTSSAAQRSYGEDIRTFVYFGYWNSSTRGQHE